MITEDDFSEVLRDNIEHSDMHGLWGIEESSKKCYELAKKMALDLLWFYADHHLDFQPCSPNRTYIDIGFNSLTEVEMFDLYLQSKEK